MEPKSVKLHPTKVADTIVKYHTIADPALDEDLCVRLVFMAMDSTIMTPNTSTYIRNVDAKWCQNLESIAGYNWCKIAHDRNYVGGSTRPDCPFSDAPFSSL
jgi:hypothetical protein